jgi:hypothetical protein
MGFMHMDTIPIPAGFTLLPIPLPPMLAALVGHNGISRWFSLSYLGTKATWSTGWLGGTFSYYAAYQPFLEHPVLLPWLAGHNLGSDDAPPDEALLCDRQAEQLLVGDYDEVEQFLRRANPTPLSPTMEDIEALRPPWETSSVEELREQGMFEFLFGPAPMPQQLGRELVAWLDQFITEDWLATFRTAAGAGNSYAVWLLREMEQRAVRRSGLETAEPMAGRHE